MTTLQSVRQRKKACREILIAVDDSEYSRAAVQQVAQMRWREGTSVLLLAAVRSDVYLIGDFFVPAVDQIEKLLREEAEQAEARLKGLAPELMATGLSVTTRVVRGDPRFAIVDTAKDETSDFVVVGSHGRSGVAKLMLGSVASHVVAHAPCSVLVVKRRAG